MYENNVAHCGSWHWGPLWRRYQAVAAGHIIMNYSIHDAIETGLNDFQK